MRCAKWAAPAGITVSARRRGHEVSRPTGVEYSEEMRPRTKRCNRESWASQWTRKPVLRCAPEGQVDGKFLGYRNYAAGKIARGWGVFTWPESVRPLRVKGLRMARRLHFLG